MKNNNFGNTQITCINWAASERQCALRAMHRAKVRPAAAVTSGWGTEVVGCDRQSVRAWLNGKGDARTAWWKLYSRVYMAVVPRADREQSTYAFGGQHHAATLVRMSYRIAIRASGRCRRRHYRPCFQHQFVAVAIMELCERDDSLGLNRRHARP